MGARREAWQRATAATAVLVVSVIAYLPSFNAAFFLDDFSAILENPALQEVFDIAAIWNYSEPRFITSLTLAANYTLHGDSVFGYHLVNFLIHLGAGLSLWLLIKGLLRTPSMSEEVRPWMYWVPLIVVAIYLLHPLQTQAVTYIVQRFASLMAMFYLASMAAYVWARLRGSILLYLAAAVCLVLAVFSKQTAATLPMALLLLELMFFRRPSRRAWTAIIGAGALLAVAAAWMLTLPAFDVVGLTRETHQISRIDYLATQIEVLWRYIGLFFFIGDQRLEYDVLVASGFTSPWTIAMAIGHLALIAAGLMLWKRLPLVAFGILFYYLAHLVESSIFPISDVAFEHRTYLPNAGLALIVGLALCWAADRMRRYRIGSIAVIVVLAVLATSTYARNELWSNQLEFLRNETRMSPGSQRAWTSLGKELMRKAQFEEATEALEEAAEIARDRDDGKLRPPTLLNMMFALHYTKRNREAVELAKTVPLEQLNSGQRASYFHARGRAYFVLGEAAQAKADLTRAARLNPTPNVVAFLAAAELDLGNRTRARQLAYQVLQSAPGNPLARDIMRRTQ